MASFMLNMPIKGIRVMGNSAVTGMGTASVTHQITIHDAAAITLQAVSSMGVGFGMSNRTKKTKGPNANPQSFAAVYGFSLAIKQKDKEIKRSSRQFVMNLGMELKLNYFN